MTFVSWQQKKDRGTRSEVSSAFGVRNWRVAVLRLR